jgi:excisionase family DNA binding protein
MGSDSRSLTQLSPPNANLVSSRMTVQEIAGRLAVGEMAVYRMLEAKIIPAVRVGKRWVVTRKAFEKWEESCGLQGVQERLQ